MNLKPPAESLKIIPLSRLEFCKKKNNVIYQFKCPLGDCISENNNIYVGLTSTTPSKRLPMHLSDTSFIAQHFKNIHAQQQNYGKFLPKTQQYYITSKKYRFSRHYIIGIYNSNLIELILKPVLMFLNVFS